MGPVKDEMSTRCPSRGVGGQRAGGAWRADRSGDMDLGLDSKLSAPEAEETDKINWGRGFRERGRWQGTELQEEAANRQTRTERQ